MEFCLRAIQNAACPKVFAPRFAKFVFWCDHRLFQRGCPCKEFVICGKYENLIVKIED